MTASLDQISRPTFVIIIIIIIIGCRAACLIFGQVSICHMPCIQLRRFSYPCSLFLLLSGVAVMVCGRFGRNPLKMCHFKFGCRLPITRKSLLLNVRQAMHFLAHFHNTRQCVYGIGLFINSYHAVDSL